VDACLGFRQKEIKSVWVARICRYSSK
jgi:hypothetical protein